MPSWPATLPDKPLAGSMSIEREAAVASFTPEVGPPLRRRRATEAIEKYSGRFALTAAQVIALKSFFETDCAEGALSFLMADWRIDTTAQFMFDAPPVFTHDSGTHWSAQVNLIKLP